MENRLAVANGRDMLMDKRRARTPLFRKAAPSDVRGGRGVTPLYRATALADVPLSLSNHTMPKVVPTNG